MGILCSPQSSVDLSITNLLIPVLWYLLHPCPWGASWGGTIPKLGLISTLPN